MHLRAPWTLATLLVVTGLLSACGRTFSTPTAPQPEVSSLAISSVSGFADGQVVAAGETLHVEGQLLAGATVHVGGFAATVIDSTAGYLDFVVPPPTAASVGSPVEVDVVAQGVTLSAGHVTVYAPPVVTAAGGVPEVGGVPDGGAEMVAPGLAVVEGENFSPRADEDAVVFAGAPAEVIVAEPGRLLVNLAASLPEGPVGLAVTITPDGATIGGARIASQLQTSRSAYVWETVPDMWISPSAVLPLQSVVFRAGDFPTALAAQLDTYGQAAPALAADGGEATVVVAPPLGLTYVPDDGQSFSSAVASAGGAGAADPDLLVCIDGVPSDQVGIDFVDDGQQWAFQIPAGYPAGSHQVQVQDPAGTGNATTLIGLQGHPAQPTFTCFALNNWVGADVEPEPLPSSASQGTQIGVAFPPPSNCNNEAIPSDSMWIKLARYEPGGALDDPFCKAVGPAALTSFTGGDPTVPVGAGRHRVYLNDGVSPELLLVSSFSQADGGPPALVINPSADAGQVMVPVAVQEPTLDSPYLWVVSRNAGTVLATVSVAVWSMNADLTSDGAVQIGTVAPAPDSGSADPFIGPGDPDCVNPSLVSAAYVAEVLNLAIACDSQEHPGFHELSLGRLALPDPSTLSAPVPLVPVWRRIQIDPTKVGPRWTAQLGLQSALIITTPPDSQRPGVVVNDNFIRDDPFGFPLQPVPGETLQIDTAALAPDGQQALVVPTDGSRVEIFEPETDPGTDVPQWRQFGSFSVPAGSTAGYVSYDSSGTQAVVLLHALAADGGATTGATGGYCVLH